jgi:hypothetical protein
LSCLGITFVAQQVGRQAIFGVRISSDLGLIFPWNSHTRDSHRCQEEAYAGFLPRSARMRSQQAFEHGQKNTSTCSTRSLRTSPWFSRNTRRRRDHPPAHVDRTISATSAVEPYTVVTARTSRSRPRPSPDLSRCR